MVHMYVRAANPAEGGPDFDLVGKAFRFRNVVFYTNILGAVITEGPHGFTGYQVGHLLNLCVQ